MRTANTHRPYRARHTEIGIVFKLAKLFSLRAQVWRQNRSQNAVRQQVSLSLYRTVPRTRGTPSL